MDIRVKVCPQCTDVPFIFARPLILPPDPIPVQDPRPQNFEIANNGSPFAPPLPWPVQASGPAVLPWYLLDDAGNQLLDDAGRPLLADGSPLLPAAPVYVTPPLPPLPDEIEWTEP